MCLAKQSSVHFDAFACGFSLLVWLLTVMADNLNCVVQTEKQDYMAFSPPLGRKGSLPNLNQMLLPPLSRDSGTWEGEAGGSEV